MSSTLLALMMSSLSVVIFASDCSLKAGFDCEGGDISNQPLPSPEDCCNLCQQTPACMAFTHAQYDGSGKHNPTCYLKTGCASQRQDGSCTAGIKSGPPRPTPPPTPSPPPPPTPSCEAGKNVTFAQPSVTPKRASLTKEQQWMVDNWPGYHNGVSFGGLFVIEDWMFQRGGGVHNPSTLHLSDGEKYSNHAWSQDLLAVRDLQKAYTIMDCHIRKYIGDEELDELANFGINSVRLVAGYWLFDDTSLYPDDKWVHEPNTSASLPYRYGVNPDGFITPGTAALSDMVIKLWNRNINVILDMHALPGCSSPRQSYAGIYCQEGAPNYWNGHASDGISGGTKVQRASDGKTWTDIGRKIALERVVPWIKFINKIAPGAIIAYELVNEPDIGSSDASQSQVRSMTLDLGKDVISCLDEAPTSGLQVQVGVSNAARNYPTSAIASDYKGSYSGMKNRVISDIHHYYAWGGCNGPDYQCVCESGLPGTGHTGEDGDWSGYINAGVFDQGWRFYVGEWSTALPQGPQEHRAGRMWLAQKWDYLSQYVHYQGKAENGESSFWGDYYWTARMGYNWDPTPGVCFGPTSTTDYKSFQKWDWSLIRLIKLGLAQPLSKLGLTPSSIGTKKASACYGSIQNSTFVV